MQIEMLVNRNRHRERGRSSLGFPPSVTELYRTPSCSVADDREDLSHQVFGPFPSRKDAL